MTTIKIARFENQNKVKESSRLDTWCTAHVNCFKVSVNSRNYQKGVVHPPESDLHIRTKFERYLFWRRKGFDVLVENRLKEGGRPDLLCWNENEIFIEEVLESETYHQFEAKKLKYPFFTTSYKCEK